MRLMIMQYHFLVFFPCSAETLPPKREERSVISQKALEEDRGRQTFSRNTVQSNVPTEGQTYPPVVTREGPVLSSKPPVSTTSIQKGESNIQFMYYININENLDCPLIVL